MKFPTLREFIEEQIALRSHSLKRGEKILIPVDFMGDQEVDDITGEILSCYEASFRVQEEYKDIIDLRLNFWVSKGDTAIKQAALKQIFEVAPALSQWIKEEKITIIEQGYYSSFVFAKEGVAYLPPESIEALKGVHLEHTEVNKRFTERVARDGGPRYIVCTEPPTMLCGIIEENKDIFKECVLAFVGGNNSREVGKEKIKEMHSAFKLVADLSSIYTTNSTTKSFSDQNNPELFECLEKVMINGKPSIIEHMAHWKEHVLGADETYFYGLIDTDKLVGQEKKAAARKAITEIYADQWTYARDADVRCILNDYQQEIARIKNPTNTSELEQKQHLEKVIFDVKRKLAKAKDLTFGGKRTCLSVDGSLCRFVFAGKDDNPLTPERCTYIYQNISSGGLVFALPRMAEEIPEETTSNVFCLIPAGYTLEEFLHDHSELQRIEKQLDEAKKSDENGIEAKRLQEIFDNHRLAKSQRLIQISTAEKIVEAFTSLYLIEKALQKDAVTKSSENIRTKNQQRVLAVGSWTKIWSPPIASAGEDHRNENRKRTRREGDGTDDIDTDNANDGAASVPHRIKR